MSEIAAHAGKPSDSAGTSCVEVTSFPCMPFCGFSQVNWPMPKMTMQTGAKRHGVGRRDCASPCTPTIENTSSSEGGSRWSAKAWA